MMQPALSVIIDIMIKDQIIQAQQDQKILFFKNAVSSVPSWKDFESNYLSANSRGGVNFASFVSMTIDRAEEYGTEFDNLIIEAQSVHPGNKIYVMGIVHFENNNTQTIPEEARTLYELFRKDGGGIIPPQFDFNLLVPQRHSDPVDGVFIQCTGSTIWRAFYKDSTEKFAVMPGDMLYIPKGVEHSVESLEPRAAISISFTDRK